MAYHIPRQYILRLVNYILIREMLRVSEATFQHTCRICVPVKPMSSRLFMHTVLNMYRKLRHKVTKVFQSFKCVV
jgi:hypothetical protein